MSALLELGLRAVGDETTRAVFGDAVLEAGWYDARVMALLYPTRRPPPYATKKSRLRRKADLEKQVPLMHSRENFDAAAGRSSPGFVVACVAVLLFGGWNKGRWQIKVTMQARKKAELAAAIERYRQEEHNRKHGGWTWDQLRIRRELETRTVLSNREVQSK